MSEEDNSSVSNYDWLTEELFEPIIEKDLSDCVCVRNDYELKLKSVKPAVGKGDNYISLVTRVELEVNFINKLERKQKIYHFIVKSSIKLLNQTEDLNVFEKEMNFYDEIANNFRKIDDTITFIPNAYSVQAHDRQIIILNDLTAIGFKMQDRLAGLDLEHCKLFYKTIAQFHALSAVYYEKFGRYSDDFHKSLYRIELKPTNDKWSEKLNSELLKIFDHYDSLRPYREKFHKWKEAIYETACEITREKLDDFNVLNHGDGWVNNMLFRHDADNKPTEICFVDFQVCVYGTPMTDILYFFATSATLEVRELHFDELLNTYHRNLTEYLIKYNYPKRIPTMRDLQMMVLRDGIMASYFLTGVTPIILLDSENSRPFSYFVKDDEEGDTFRYNVYNTPRFIKAVEVTLKFLDQRGLLEFK